MDSAFSIRNRNNGVIAGVYDDSENRDFLNHGKEDRSLVELVEYLICRAHGQWDELPDNPLLRDRRVLVIAIAFYWLDIPSDMRTDRSVWQDVVALNPMRILDVPDEIDDIEGIALTIPLDYVASVLTEIHYSVSGANIPPPPLSSRREIWPSYQLHWKVDKTCSFPCFFLCYLCTKVPALLDNLESWEYILLKLRIEHVKEILVYHTRNLWTTEHCRLCTRWAEPEQKGIVHTKTDHVRNNGALMLRACIKRPELFDDMIIGRRLLDDRDWYAKVLHSNTDLMRKSPRPGDVLRHRKAIAGTIPILLA